ncbi:unnamed protein product [Auanema sp. JU1783]|nr:unnamed protein product [Auanema sp. JU1783]
MQRRDLDVSIRLLFISSLLVSLSLCSYSDSLEDNLKEALYKKCWKECLDHHQVSPSHEAVLALINRKFSLEKHEKHCRSYNESKKCAHSCLSSPNHEYYLRPFVRQNYLNDFICARHYDDFRKYLPCYQGHTSLEQYFIRCGYFAIESDDSSVLQANPQTCAALRCVTRYIPGLIRQQCTSLENAKMAHEAGDLMERMVTAFLREKLHLNRMKRQCEDSDIIKRS